MGGGGNPARCFSLTFNPPRLGEMRLLPVFATALAPGLLFPGHTSGITAVLCGRTDPQAPYPCCSDPRGRKGVLSRPPPTTLSSYPALLL